MREEATECPVSAERREGQPVDLQPAVISLAVPVLSGVIERGVKQREAQPSR